MSKEDFLDNIKLEKVHNKDSKIKKVIGIVSGKGGVGKSLVTSLMAIESNRRSMKTAILDGDITGPSIPKIFNIHTKATGNETSIFPVDSKSGIKIMSINVLVDDETEPVIWRGPVISGAVRQFWTDVVWGDIDVMFIDMPPGTGDVPLTVFQTIPVDGIIVVASPQELVDMIVSKAVKMADSMNIPILGIVENMSYFKCPECGEISYIFGNSRVEEIAERFGVENVLRIPIRPEVSALCDRGELEAIDETGISEFFDTVISAGQIKETK